MKINSISALTEIEVQLLPTRTDYIIQSILFRSTTVSWTMLENCCSRQGRGFDFATQLFWYCFSARGVSFQKQPNEN